LLVGLQPNLHKGLQFGGNCEIHDFCVWIGNILWPLSH